MAYIVDYADFHTHRLYNVNIHGNEIKVTVTAVASVVRKWISTTLFLFRRRTYLQSNHLVAGLGVQWTPNGRYSPPDTLQLCVGHRCLIFQLAHANYIPRNLRNFLQNPNHTFVGFWNHSDRRKLEELSVHQLRMYREPLDLRHCVQVVDEDGDEEGLARASVPEIVEKCLGYDVEDELRGEIGRSDWNDEDLRHEQVVYASVDAYCAFLIGKNIKAWKYYTC